jgi:hypothetical protein
MRSLALCIVLAVGAFMPIRAPSFAPAPVAAATQAPAASDSLQLFDTEEAAQKHCPKDQVVWLNTRSGTTTKRGCAGTAAPSMAPTSIGRELTRLAIATPEMGNSGVLIATASPTPVAAGSDPIAAALEVAVILVAFGVVLILVQAWKYTRHLSHIERLEELRRDRDN